MTECVNLRVTFGDRFQVRLEPPARSWNDPWYHIIPCRFGHIYPHGAGRLGFASDCRGAIAKRVAALPFATVTQDASDGMNITFPAEHFDEVARIVRPKRRRRLCDAQRAASIERLRKYRLTSGKTSASAARHDAKSTLKRIGSDSPDPEDLGGARDE